MTESKPPHAPESLTHLDAEGRARMVDVSEKRSTRRIARASAVVRMTDATLSLLQSGQAPKGDVLATARIAGIQAAKRTPELIPLCHAIALSSVEVHFEYEAEGIRIDTMARCLGTTGVEMEALTAASVAALTLYDMLKAVDRAMVIGPIQLEEKEGGRSGHWTRSDANG